MLSPNLTVVLELLLDALAVGAEFCETAEDVTAVAVEFAVCDPTPLFHVTSARIEYPTEETLPYKY